MTRGELHCGQGEERSSRGSCCTPREPILLSAHTRAIIGQALQRGAGVYGIEVRIEGSGWWEPAKKGRARILAQRLAVGMCEQWDALNP